MDCDSARESLSAAIDGEDTGQPAGALEAHLEGCLSCRQWQERAYRLTRRARLGGASLGHDLAPRILAAAPATESRWRRRTTQRAALLALALAQCAIAVPMLVLGHDHDAGAHAAHELGSFNLALAAAFAVGAFRPKLCAGLAWPCAIAAAGLVVTAIADLFSGQALGADEAQHLVAVAGAALLAWQANTTGAESAGSAVRADADREAPWPAAAGDFPERETAPPEPPGGHAARLAERDESIA
jgi:predicted anti-sigma-YlaC factor YlaD